MNCIGALYLTRAHPVQPINQRVKCIEHRTSYLESSPESLNCRDVWVWYSSVFIFEIAFFIVFDLDDLMGVHVEMGSIIQSL